MSASPPTPVVPPGPTRTCPRCGMAVPAMAYVCAYCKKRLRTGPLALGCAAVFGLFLVLVYVVGNSVSEHPSPEPGKQSQKPFGLMSEGENGVDGRGVPFVARRDSKGKYMGMPEYKVGEPAGRRAIVHVRGFLKLKPQGIKPALAAQLGAGAHLRFDRREPSWTGSTETVSVEVSYFHGRVDTVNITFKKPAQDYAAALDLIDLKPSTPPTMDAVGAARWSKKFEGIDEVMAVHQPFGSPAISMIQITPDLKLAKEAESSQ
jgi:hypothetical protein